MAHYPEGQETLVSVVRIGEHVSLRTLDLLDLLDFWKVWIRTQLFDHPTYGLQNETARSQSHPTRWFHQSPPFGEFKGISLDFCDNDK